MAQAQAEKQYNNFTAGLITEASPLTFPDNSALDIRNLILERTGKVSRRLGVNFEIAFAKIATGLAVSTIANSKVSFHRWDTPSGDTTSSIGIVRVHNKLWFLNLLSSSPSDDLLNQGNSLTITGLADSNLDTASILNNIILVSADMEVPIMLTYNKTTDIVSSEVVPIQVRDIWGVVDTIPIDTRPVTLTDTHNYNLVNQGWSPAITSVCGTVSTDTVQTTTSWQLVKTGADLAQAIVDGTYQFGSTSGGWVKTETLITPGAPISVGAVECTKTKIGVYPSNSDIWTLGKIGDASSVDFEKYDPDSMKKNSIYKVEAPKGAMLIDAFTRGASRQSLTGLTTLPQDEELGRINTVESFSSRVFYSGISSDVTGPDDKSPNYSGYIFFSQTCTAKDLAGKCYQDADPTSPTINDIVDTDGGTIQIPEITKIWKLLATRVSLLVFAENGIWEIFGDTGGFKATSFQISKITSVGCNSPFSVIDTSEGILYWAKSGIFILTQNQVSGRYQADNLSISTIQSFYNAISDLGRQYVKGYYEQSQNRVRWIYNDLTDYSVSTYINKYNKELILDLTLKSFYVNEFTMTEESPFIADYAPIPKFATALTDDQVYVGSNLVMADTLEVISPHTVVQSSRETDFKFLVMDQEASFTLGEYNNQFFKDWISYDGTGFNFSSYIITGFELYGDMLRKKQVPYLVMALERTETGYTSGDSGFDLLDASSCLVQTQWNWTNNVNSGKWSYLFQAYRFKRLYTPDSDGTFDDGEAVIVTKNKLRGTGKCLSLFIQSEEGKDMRILGWGTTLTGGAKV